ncbi:MAG: hypothetical protein ACLPVF_15880 [Acidimicrobiales bacterium]
MRRDGETTGTGRRRRALWPAGAGAGALALLLTAAPAAGATTNATTLYQQSLASMRSWSVHYTSSGVDAKVMLVESGDAGPASGTQQFVIGSGATAEAASMIVIGQLTYFEGNAAALEYLLGFSATQAAADTGQWVLFPTADAQFSQVVAGVRSHDVAEEVALRGPLTLGAPRRLDGYRVDAIRGTEVDPGAKPMRAVLYVRASGRHLPVEEDTVNAQGRPNGMEDMVFSKWGERVRPKAPDATITLGPMHAV